MRHLTKVIALVAGLVLAGTSAAQSSFPRERLDSRHWSYSELEELCASGVLDSFQVSMRPVSRGDVARALLAAPAAAQSDPRIVRLRREFAPEIAQLDSAAAPPYTHPILTSREGGSEMRFRPRVQAGMSRGVGDYWRSDPVTLVTLQGTWAYSPHFLFNIEMLGQGIEGSRRYAEPFFPNTDITTLAGQVYGTASFAPFEITLGRDHMSWGIGQTGALILGDAAPWMSFIEYGAHYKDLRARVFTAQLDEVSGNYLSGHRIEWRASPKIQIGFSETARYISRQPDILYLLGVMPYQVIQKINNAQSLQDSGGFDSNRNNIMIALDGFWRPRPGVQLGASYLIDELRLSQNVPGRTGYQLNALVSGVNSTRPLSLRAEFTSIRNYVYSVNYGQNYIFQDASLAYPLGPDVRLLNADLRWDVSRDVRVWLGGSYKVKGEGRLGESIPSVVDHSFNSDLEGVIERTHGAEAGARWQPRDNIRLEALFGVRRIRNAGHIEGARDSQAVGHILADVHW